MVLAGQRLGRLPAFWSWLCPFRTGCARQLRRSRTLAWSRRERQCCKAICVRFAFFFQVGSWVEAALEERNYADEVQTTTKILKDQKVKGTALLDLTYDRLVNQPYNIAAGPASQLAKRIAALAAPAAAASGFQAGGQALGHFSFARGCALQANTVQSVIEDGGWGGCVGEPCVWRSDAPAGERSRSAV